MTFETPPQEGTQEQRAGLIEKLKDSARTAAAIVTFAPKLVLGLLGSLVSPGYRPGWEDKPPSKTE